MENMTPGLNEMLLWHGTSQKAAEAPEGGLQKVEPRQSSGYLMGGG